jgi:hypothetical protein
MLPLTSLSLSNKKVIRKPDSTKKKVTPKSPLTNMLYFIHWYIELSLIKPRNNAA